ncbi:uncharacterized protein MYCFIDRAFT_142614 [Pseudocercospora fijiensis CIRAD86]|uniref:STEEP1 domain-containing protein n=1 Tax=Pseudocercospora fijiensis (strain CIRAD86) TaxID=383855 RepID=M2ZKK9_PSEFD|nr:uncharacterized protein MYCFIDRAFT_142614 [Pseudocercospora fijiensis CIRAD86]EME79614.1 hypothetical protein MYCFIDRAFT_142614 [Pseudocercospora fijiensis CIRAD86]
MATPTVSTYHCICSELLLATPIPLDTLPLRQSDKSHICKINQGESIAADSAVLTKAARFDSNSLILKLEDGFEKRYLIKCGRCGVAFAYRLDEILWNETDDGGVKEDVAFLLPNGLVTTKDMESGEKLTEKEAELQVQVMG